MTGTFAGVVPVRTVDGRTIGTGERGPVVTGCRSCTPTGSRATSPGRIRAVTGRAVAMWSGPRNISTAMMRAWENRPDTVVVDEPLYAAYLAAHRARPSRPRGGASPPQPTSLAEAVAALHAPLPTAHRPLREAHGPPPRHASRTPTWIDAFRNVLLIRDPAEVVASYVRSREACEPDDIGLLQQQWLIDALGRGRPRRPGDRRRRLPRATPRRTCAGSATGSASSSPTGCCLAGRAARLRRRLGAVLVRRGAAPRPASRRTGRARSTSRRTTPRSPRPAGRRTTRCTSVRIRPQ